MRFKCKSSMCYILLQGRWKYIQSMAFPCCLWLLIFRNIIDLIQIYSSIFCKKYKFIIFLFTMYAQFFKQSRPRYENPTYQSNSFLGSMLYPLKYQIVRSHYQQPKNTIINNSSTAGIKNYSQNYSTMNQMVKSKQLLPRKISMVESTTLTDPYRHRRSKSNLSGYGTNSLQSFPKVNDKKVFQHQQHQYNILSLAPKQYSQSIKMFPKFRNQIKQDEPNRIRQAFISGKPNQGLSKSRVFIQKNDNKVSYKPNQRQITNVKIKNYGSKSLERLNPQYGR